MTTKLSFSVRNHLRRAKRNDFLQDLSKKQSKILESYGFSPRIYYAETYSLLREGIYSPSDFKWEAGSLDEFLPWGRERFTSSKAKVRKGRQLVSYTKTFFGHRIVRGFVRSFTKSEFEAYEIPGRKSCPVEAVWLPAVRAGYPALPAYPFVLALDKANEEHSRGLDAVLTLVAAGLLTKDIAENLDWFRTRKHIASDWEYRFPIGDEDF